VTVKKTALIALVSVILFVWGAAAIDYSDSVVSGTYSLVQNGETSTLVLMPDHTFQQDVSHSGKVTHAEGTWRRLGEGGIAFSREFLVLSGQELSAQGNAYADMHKTLGLFVSLVLTDYHVVWYGKVDPSPDKATPGTYTGDEGGASATLTLGRDHTFEQVITHDGVAKHAKGSWSLSGSGDIVFSKEFLKTSGESLRDDETASANLQIKIAAVSRSGGPPTYRKRQFRR
jgi:hypothetical protein